MERLDTKIASILNCQISHIADKMNHPDNLKKVESFLNGKQLQTIYKNHIGEIKEFPFGGFTKKSARKQMAYNGFKNVTIDQHFYIRHRICLQYPNNPCVTEKFKNGHDRIYPLELVRIIEILPRTPLCKPSCRTSGDKEKDVSNQLEEFVDMDDDQSWTYRSKNPSNCSLYSQW